MLLQRLKEYALREGLVPPSMYREVPIRYVIELDNEGHCLGSVDCSGPRYPDGPLRLVPDCRRSSDVKPRLLSDDAEYTLGYTADEGKMAKVQERHAAYVRLVNECATATGESSVQAVAWFLSQLDTGEADLPEHFTFDARGRIMFDVDGVRPADPRLETVRDYWSRVAAVGSAEQTKQCLVCGAWRPPVKRMALVVQGLPGGLPGGLPLISADETAYHSYGQEYSLTAPTCEECGQAFSTALSVLLKQPQTHLCTPSLAHVFWTHEPTPRAISPSLIERANSDDVRYFLRAPEHAHEAATDLDDTPYYVATLSGRKSRMVVRDWFETTLSDARAHLKRYFALMQILDGYGDTRWFGLRTLTETTIHQGSREQPLPQIGQALLHTAMQGGPLPLSLLYQVLRRIRADPAPATYTETIQAARAALIKMVLLSQEQVRWLSHLSTATNDVLTADRERGIHMASLDPTCSDEAYVCGRLFAVLETIQREAIPNISATIAKRYLGTASTAPASILGRLIINAQDHLAKLQGSKQKQFAGNTLEKDLQEITNLLPPHLPHTFNPIQQGLFALGYYHQKSAMSRAKQAFFAKRAGSVPSQDQESTNTSIPEETLARTTVSSSEREEQ